MGTFRIAFWTLQNTVDQLIRMQYQQNNGGVTILLGNSTMIWILPLCEPMILKQTEMLRLSITETDKAKALSQTGIEAVVLFLSHSIWENLSLAQSWQLKLTVDLF